MAKHIFLFFIWPIQVCTVHHCSFSLKVPLWGTSNEYQQHIFSCSSSKKNTLRKHDYSNILQFLLPKNENFQIKNSDIFLISAQNIDCGYSLEPPQWGGSNEYPQSMFLSRNKKNNVYPCKPQFYYIKVGFKGDKIIFFKNVFVMINTFFGWKKVPYLELWHYTFVILYHEQQAHHLYWNETS